MRESTKATFTVCLKVINYILDVMLTASVHVFRGEWPNTSELEHGMFQLIYRALSPYLSEKNIQQL